MREVSCSHCNNPIKSTDTTCPKCGMPLPPPEQRHLPHQTFIYWFIGVVLFCIIMMIWLPPDWSHLGK